MKKDKDHFQRRCPRLGGPVTFGYCRTSEPDQGPCGKILDCWWEYFDVVEHLSQNLNVETFYRIATYRPRPKILSLIDLVEQAKKKSAADQDEPK